jgi:hypothetical protein
VEEKSADVERVGAADILVGAGICQNEQPNINTIGLISGIPNSDDTCLPTAYDHATVLDDG